MLEFIPFIANTIISGLAGALLHETTHYAIWKAAGRNPSINLRKLHVTPHAGPDKITRLDRIAAAAPIAIGFSLLPLIIINASFPLIVGWLVYTIGGARSDYETIIAEN